MGKSTHAVGVSKPTMGGGRSSFCHFGAYLLIK